MYEAQLLQQPAGSWWNCPKIKSCHLEPVCLSRARVLFDKILLVATPPDLLSTSTPIFPLSSESRAYRRHRTLADGLFGQGYVQSNSVAIIASVIVCWRLLQPP